MQAVFRSSGWELPTTLNWIRDSEGIDGNFHFLASHFKCNALETAAAASASPVFVLYTSVKRQLPVHN